MVERPPLEVFLVVGLVDGRVVLRVYVRDSKKKTRKCSLLKMDICRGRYLLRETREVFLYGRVVLRVNVRDSREKDTGIMLIKDRHIHKELEIILLNVMVLFYGRTVLLRICLGFCDNVKVNERLYLVYHKTKTVYLELCVISDTTAGNIAKKNNYLVIH